MPIDKPSTKVFFDDERLRIRFKQLVAEVQTSMTKRLEAFIKFDIAFWERTGKPFNFTNADASDLPSDVEAVIKKAIGGERLGDCELGILADHFNLDQRELTAIRDSKHKKGTSEHGTTTKRTEGMDTLHH